MQNKKKYRMTQKVYNGYTMTVGKYKRVYYTESTSTYL